MDPAALPLLAVVLVVFAAVAVALVLAWFFFTRCATHPGEASRRVPCGFRTGQRGWTMGTLSYEEHQLVYRSPHGPLRTRELCWQRSSLGVGIGQSVDGGQINAHWHGNSVMAVPCTVAGETFELAISEERYTALRSWVEAVPPGWNVNVA